MSLNELLHHVQLCRFLTCGECDRGDCCTFAHHLEQLREPTQEFLQWHKTRKFHKWSAGDILPDRHRVCETITWATWDLQQGLAPPEWVYKLHFHATLKYGDEYLNDVSRILGKLCDVPDDARRPESTSPKPENKRRKRRSSPSEAPLPKKTRHHCQHEHGQHPKDRVITKGPHHPPYPPPAHLIYGQQASTAIELTEEEMDVVQVELTEEEMDVVKVELTEEEMDVLKVYSEGDDNAS